MTIRRMIGIVVILWIGVVFYFSSRPGQQSLEDSSRILMQIRQLGGDHSPIDMDSPEVQGIQDMIRDTAHQIIFGVMAVMLYIALYDSSSTPIMTGVLAWALTSMYGAIDELHQYFVPGRGAEVADIITDSKGAFVGCLLMICLTYIGKMYQSGKKKRLV